MRRRARRSSSRRRRLRVRAPGETRRYWRGAAAARTRRRPRRCRHARRPVRRPPHRPRRRLTRGGSRSHRRCGARCSHSATSACSTRSTCRSSTTRAAAAASRAQTAARSPSLDFSSASFDLSSILLLAPSDLHLCEFSPTISYPDTFNIYIYSGMRSTSLNSSRPRRLSNTPHYYYKVRVHHTLES